MSLAERLKQVRESLGYTQKEMAKAVSVILQTWQVYEAGKSVPGGNVLESLARLGFNVNWILTGEGEMKRGDSNQILSLDEDLLASIIISVIDFAVKNLDEDLALASATSIIQLYNFLSKSKKPYTPETIKEYIILFSKIAEISNGDSDVINEIIKGALEMTKKKSVDER
jgi:transcriptional regulator with XRE-family HTH domain